MPHLVLPVGKHFDFAESADFTFFNNIDTRVANQLRSCTYRSRFWAIYVEDGTCYEYCKQSKIRCPIFPPHLSVKYAQTRHQRHINCNENWVLYNGLIICTYLLFSNSMQIKPIVTHNSRNYAPNNVAISVGTKVYLYSA